MHGKMNATTDANLSPIASVVAEKSSSGTFARLFFAVSNASTSSAVLTCSTTTAITTPSTLVALSTTSSTKKEGDNNHPGSKHSTAANSPPNSVQNSDDSAPTAASNAVTPSPSNSFRLLANLATAILDESGKKMDRHEDDEEDHDGGKGNDDDDEQIRIQVPAVSAKFSSPAAASMISTSTKVARADDSNEEEEEDRNDDIASTAAPSKNTNKNKVRPTSLWTEDSVDRGLNGMVRQNLYMYLLHKFRAHHVSEFCIIGYISRTKSCCAPNPIESKSTVCHMILYG